MGVATNYVNNNANLSGFAHVVHPIIPTVYPYPGDLSQKNNTLSEEHVFSHWLPWEDTIFRELQQPTQSTVIRWWEIWSMNVQLTNM